MTVKVGVFWFCNFDIIYDVEVYEVNDNDKDFYSYSKHHKEVWNKLSIAQFNGKYSKYSYDFFQRGRVYYDAEIKKYSIEMNSQIFNLPKSKILQLKQIFKI